MATILKGKARAGRRFVSIRVRFLLTYVSLIAVVVVILNTYPLSISRDLVFASKKTALQNQAGQIGTSVEALESLTTDTVGQVMAMLETNGISEVRIVNSDWETLYQSSSQDSAADEDNARSLLTQALAGNDVFRSVFRGGAFSSSASVPVLSKGSVVAAVYVFEYDADEGTIILGLQNDLRKFSVALTVLALFLSFVYSKTLTHRITKVLDAIKTVREGEYTYRISVTGHDELAQLSEEFNSLTDRLQSTEEIRRRFVADASHELKTPLASIILLSDSILQSEQIDPGTMREFVGDIKGEAERLTRTTGKLLDLTKLDNNIATVRAPVDFSSVCEKAVHMLQPLADSKGVKVACGCTGECTVLASDDDLYQIVLNLVENAIKYNREGGRVDVSLKNNDGLVTLTVDDTGVGVPSQDLPYIFDRFYRVDKARSREAGGSGLGLSIVKSTAEKHGGEIRAERREEGGMRFSVTFPVYTTSRKDV